MEIGKEEHLKESRGASRERMLGVMVARAQGEVWSMPLETEAKEDLVTRLQSNWPIWASALLL